MNLVLQVNMSIINEEGTLILQESKEHEITWIERTVRPLDNTGKAIDWLHQATSRKLNGNLISEADEQSARHLRCCGGCGSARRRRPPPWTARRGARSGAGRGTTPPEERPPLAAGSDLGSGSAATRSERSRRYMMRSDQGRLGDWILTSGGGESSYHYHHHHRILLAADAGAGRRSAGCRQVDRSMRRASLGLRNQKKKKEREK